MRVYLRAMRLPFLSGSLSPVILGGSYAWFRHRFHLPAFLLVATGVACLHIGANLINDYYDAPGTDRINRRVTPFSGGSRVIQQGLLSRDTVLYMSVLFFAAAVLAGIVLAVWRTPGVLLVGLAGLLAGWLYSYGPVRLMSRGLGELTIFFAFGPLITFGTYYALAGVPQIASFWLGIPSGFLITAVIWINEFPDFEADRDTGKHNLVIRIGLERSRQVYFALLLLPFVATAILAAAAPYSPWLLLDLAAIPLAARAIRRLSRDPDNHSRIVPVQALTIQTNLLTGLLMSLGLVLDRIL